jgi:uncharacterized protein YjbI with pentapeptide repeats/predicted NAD-dependent protein-ADP-ribosyltransferase YbiA (DUF1768 family)
MIYTTGLNAYTPDALHDTISELSDQGPLLVVDARSSRYSRSFAYRNDFTARMEDGIGYRWDPRIGGHPDVANLYNDVGRISYPALIETPFFKDGITQLINDAERVANVLVICACDNHSTCHRTRAVGRALVERGLDARELGVDRMSSILEGMTATDRDLSERPVPRSNRHGIPKTLEPRREPKNTFRPPPEYDRRDQGPPWEQRLAARYANAPARSATDTILLTTLDSPEALQALEHANPSFVVDFRQNEPVLTLGDADVIRPKMSADGRIALMRELAKIQDRRRGIAIIVNDPQRIGLPAAIRDGGALLAGLKVDVGFIDHDGAIHGYAAAMALSTPHAIEERAAAADAARQNIPDRRIRDTDGERDIFAYAQAYADRGSRVAILIPTNLQLRTAKQFRDQRVGIMGAGLALAARDAFPDLKLEYRLGERATADQPAILANANEPGGPPYAIVAFHTKQSLAKKSSLELIERQAAALDGVLKAAGDFDMVVIPRVGTGHGGLDWNDVKTVLDRHLQGPKFVMLERGASNAQRTDDYAAMIQKAHERPPTDERFKEFASYAHTQAAVVSNNRDALGSLLPTYERSFQLPAASSTLPFPSVEHARRALLVPDSPEYQRELAGLRRGARFPNPPAAKTERDVLARERARLAEPRLLDYAMRVAIAQDPDARAVLMSTGTAPIVVSSSNEAWWSAVNAGDHYQGYNVMGKILTGIRDDLARDPNALARIDPPAIPELQMLGQPLAAFTGLTRPAAATQATPMRSMLRSVMTYAGIGMSDGVPEATFAYHRNAAHALAAASYQLRTGAADSMDKAHMLGVTDYLQQRYGENWRSNDRAKEHAKRLVDIWTPGKKHERLAEELGLPFHRFDEHDPQLAWAVKAALKTHPNPRALYDFSLRAHARNAVIALGEDGKHAVEFGLCYAPMDHDGLPTGGSRGVPAILAELGDYPFFNTIDPQQITTFNAYLEGIQRGTLRFGDGRDAAGGLYISPRSGPNLAGQDLSYMDPRSTPLVEANLAQAKMTGVVLDKLDMTRAYAPNLDAASASLDATATFLYAPGANFSDAKLSGTWNDATLRGADLSGATLDGNFVRSRFDSATLREARLEGQFVGANFTGADLTNAQIIGRDVESLRGIDLRDATTTNLRLMPEAVNNIDRLGIKINEQQRAELVRNSGELTRT